MKNNRLVLLILLFFTYHAGFGQCCSAGNPAGGDGTHTYLPKNQIKLNFFYEYSLSKDYYSGNEAIEMSALEKSYYNFLNLGIQYAINNRLIVQSDFGYFINKTQDLTLNQAAIKLQTKGFGDLSLQARYLIYQSLFPEIRWSVGLGTRIPIGAFHETMDGVQIPVSLQPSCGALKFQASSFLFFKPKGKKLSYFAFVLYEKSNTIRENYLIHQYGDYQLFVLGTNYNFKNRWNISGKIKYELRGKDIRDETIQIESTGSSLVLFSPAVEYQTGNDWSISASLDVPVYKQVNGMQLTKYGSIQIGVTKKI